MKEKEKEKVEILIKFGHKVLNRTYSRLKEKTKIHGDCLDISRREIIMRLVNIKLTRDEIDDLLNIMEKSNKVEKQEQGKRFMYKIK